MWHELVLHGVGGRTIEEAKERMSQSEAVSWSHYINTRGSLNLGTRMEWGFALLAFMVEQALGGKRGMEAFMPHREQSVGSLEDVMKIFKGDA